MKGIMKKVTAIFMAIVMVVSCIVVGNITAKAEEYVVNPAEYDIHYLLSNYQIYVKGDLATSGDGHQMGSLIVGGDANLGVAFGDASIAPTYLNHISNYNHTAYQLSGTEWEAYGNLNIYYTSSYMEPINSSPRVFTKVDSYIDFEKAFDEIESQSKRIAQEAVPVEVDSDGYIYLDVSDATAPHNYVIEEEQFLAAKAICFKGTDNSLDAFRYVDNPITISVKGMETVDVEMDFNGEGAVGTYTIGVKWDTNEDANENTYSTVNGALKELEGSEIGDQLNPYGTNLLWNFPDATNTVHTSFLAGHLVAPKATVKMAGGNYEGGFIAASADIEAEGHFYPYYKIGTATSDAPMNPSIEGSDFIITVADAKNVDEDDVIDLSDAQYFATTGATGDNTKVNIEDVADLNAVTEPGKVELTISDGSGNATTASSVNVTATVVQYKEAKEYNGPDNQPVLVQLGANDFEMSIAQAQAYLGKQPSEDAANTMLKTLANAVAIDGGQAVDRSQIYVASQNIAASEGVYNVQFAYNNTYVSVKVTVKDDGPTDKQTDKTDVPDVNLTGNDFIVKGGSATLTPEAFVTKAEVTSKNTDGSTRTDITVDATDLAALNTKIKNAEATPQDAPHPVKVYSGGVTTTVYVTVQVGYPYISADDFIISTTDVENITDPETTVKDLSDAKKITSSIDATGDKTVIDVDDTDETDLMAQKTPGLVEIVISDTTANEAEKAPATSIIATVVDDTDENMDANTGKKIVIGANNFNISEEELAAVTGTRNAGDEDANKKAADNMVKILANAVATDDGDAVSRDDIKVATFTQKDNNEDVYDVTFTYTDASGNTVTAQVEAHVKDAGPTDGENDVTDVPSINLTANDFSVEGGSPAFTADTFKPAADVEANYNTGEEIAVGTVTVDQDDLEALNEKIANKETGECTVDVSVGGVTTTVTVTVTDRYPHIKANDFIVGLENNDNIDEDDAKDLSQAKRYDKTDGGLPVEESLTENVKVADSELQKIKDMDEPGTVDITFTDSTSGNTADPETVKVTVVDKTNIDETNDTESPVIIGANHYYLSVEQAQAIVDARTGSDDDKEAANALNKALSNVVATNSGTAVDVANIVVDASNIKAEKGTYNVTFAYQGQSVTVTATVQDAGSTDNKNNPTAIPVVSLTGNNLRVKGGSATFENAQAFITAAQVEAQNLDGSSRTDIHVDNIELSNVNDKITEFVEGTYPVDVTSGGVTTTIMVTVYIEDAAIDANDFIISVEDAKQVADSDEVEELAGTTVSNIPAGSVEISDEDIQKLTSVTEPGTVGDITLTDKTGNADDVVVKATVVDVTDATDDGKVVIGANNFNVTIAQAEAIENNPTSEDVKTMVKTLANAVATDDGEPVPQDKITIDNVTAIKAENGDYEVTFTYTKEGSDTPVSVTVIATVKDDGAGDKNADQTQVPDVNVTGNDFTVKVGTTPEITAEDFVKPDKADVDANYNDGSSVPKNEITVDQTDLDKLNDAIAAGETGTYEVDVTADGETVTIKVTVTDEKIVDDTNKEVIAANNFEIEISDYDTVVPSKDKLIALAGALAYDSETRADVEIVSAEVKDAEKKAGEYDVTFETAAGSAVTVKMTINAIASYPKLDADNFIISVEDAKDAEESVVKDLSDTNRYTTPDEETAGTSNGDDKVTVPDLSDLTGMDEPGSVDLTLKDNNDDPADEKTVTATVVDVTDATDDGTVVIGANNFNISQEQADAVLAAENNGNTDKTDAMVKLLANAVATDNGTAVQREDIVLESFTPVPGKTDEYNVSFSYTDENGRKVTADVIATVKDAGTTDEATGATDPTDVPNVNLTADDFTVAGGSDEISEDEFKDATRANVEANNQDGSSIPTSSIDVDDDDLGELNEKIAAGEATTVDVKVSVVDPTTGDTVQTVVTVTITEKYPKIDADDFIVTVDETEGGFDKDDVKDASNATLVEDSNGTTGTTTNINPDTDAVDALDGRDEPGTVPVTLKDTTGRADDKEVIATVVDKKTVSQVDGVEVVIGANDFNVTIEQAQAIQGNPNSEAVKTMVKTLANAVATDDGRMVPQANIDINDVTVIKAKNGEYEVTFTYTKEGSNSPVAVTVTATVKDAGANDGATDQTDVPDVNVTGNDFTVKVGTTPEITAEDFVKPDKADIDANYNDGSSVPEDEITVNQADLDKLNDAIESGKTGPVDVKVTADGETTTITVTVADEKTVDNNNDEVIAANNFEIKLADYDTVVDSDEELIERASAIAYDATTRADVAIVSAEVKNPEKKAGEYEVTFETAAGSAVTVTMTIDTTPSITAHDFNISMEQAQTIVGGQADEDVMDMVKALANAVAKDDDVVVTDTSEITVDASKVKAAKGTYDVTFTYDGVPVTVKATVKDNSAADGDADKTDVPEVNLTANDFTIAAGSDPLTDKTFNDKADTEAKKNDGTPVTDIKVDQADLAKVNDAIANGTEGEYQVKVTAGNDTAVVTVTVTKQDDIKGVDQIYEISNPKDVPQDLAEGRTVKTVNVNGKDIPASAYTVENGKLKIKSSVFKDYKEGTYPVVITYKDGSKHTFNVKVIPYDEATVVKKVPTFHMQKDLGVGKKFKLNLVGMNKTAVKKFTSSNKKIATIDKNGVIKGKKKGKCKITATVIQKGSYYTVKIDLHVKKSMKMYNLKKAALQKKQGILPEFNVYKRVVKGKKTKLKFTNVEKDAKITYKSSNKKVATVSKKGVIKGKKKGFAVVTAKIQQNGFTYYTKLIVRVDDGTKNKQLKKYLK